MPADWWEYGGRCPFKRRLSMAGGERGPGSRTSLSSALKGAWSLAASQFSSVFVTPCSLPRAKCLWHIAHSHERGNLKICRHMHAETLSARITKTATNAQREGTTHLAAATGRLAFFNLGIIFDCIFSVLRDFKETCSALGPVIKEWVWRCDLAMWLPDCRRETGQAPEKPKC